LDFTCEELHAITAAMREARARGLFTLDDDPHAPAVTLARSEARIAVRKARGLPVDLQREAIDAIVSLAQRVKLPQKRGA
jgi:hypothetical protein